MEGLRLVSRQFRKRFGSMGCRPRARSVLHCHGVLALRDRPVQEGGRMEGPRLAVQKATLGSMGLVSRQFRKKATLGSMGCRPRARSVLHCHCVSALRDRPLAFARPARVQEGGRMEGLRLVSRQFRKQRWTVWAAGRGPVSHFTGHGILALRDRPLSGALMAVQEGGRMEGLRLVSRQFRKRRLAVWAAVRGPDPHFTAMVFWLCETVL